MTRAEQERRLAAHNARHGTRVVLPSPGKAVAPPAAPRRLTPLACVDRGPRLAGQPCGSPLYACKIYGTCSMYTACDGAKKVCAACDERVVPLTLVAGTGGAA